MKTLHAITRRLGNAFKQLLTDALRLSRPSLPKRRNIRLETASLGGPLPGIDLRKALVLSDSIEDTHLAHKLAARK